MGRRTFESIGRALPGRHNIVVSRADRPSGSPAAASPAVSERVSRVRSLDEALSLAAREAGEAMVIGGGEIYRGALPLAHRVHRTRIHAQMDGDTFFAELDPREWRLTHSEAHAADARHAQAMTFEVLERVPERISEPARGSGP
jgi:dihydrofolate reductase